MRRRVVAIAVLGSVVFPAGLALASWSMNKAVGGNTFSTITLAAPTGPTAQASCNGSNTAKMALTWNSVTHADGYEVKRATASGGPYTLRATVTGTSHTDTGLSVNTRYWYVIVAARGPWQSGNSAEATDRTPIVCL